MSRLLFLAASAAFLGSDQKAVISRPLDCDAVRR
jgi:hypothetical protein